jgi:hypothetical protein
VRPSRPAPARQAERKWGARMSLTLTTAMKKALERARVEDGIEGTARIRAMIALWQSDERLRQRIDREALFYRDRE